MSEREARKAAVSCISSSFGEGMREELGGFPEPGRRVIPEMGVAHEDDSWLLLTEGVKVLTEGVTRSVVGVARGGVWKWLGELLN